LNIKSFVIIWVTGLFVFNLLHNDMANKKKPKVRNEELEAFHNETYDSFRDIIPVNRSFELKFKNASQRLAFASYEQNDILFLLGAAGSGKALTLDSKLYTRTGPIRMGDVKIGDEIADHTGNFSKVTGVFPQGKKQINRVWFSDETFVDCCEDHLWEVKHDHDRGRTRVVDTNFLRDNCRRRSGEKRQLSVICSAPVNFDRREFLVPPYLMGIILSEGNVTNANLSFSTCEASILQRASSELLDDYVCKAKPHHQANCIDYRIVKKVRSGQPNVYKDALREMGVWGKLSYEKFIPEDYLYGSVDQRVALLQGMMDGDGTVGKTGSMSYSTTSFKLAEDFCQLVRSLGGVTRIRPKKGSLKSDGLRHRVSYRCYLNMPNDIEVFFLDRKKLLCKPRIKYFPKRYVDRVQIMDNAEMQCIVVDNLRHLYLTDNFIVTHNTHLACMFALHDFISEHKSRIILTRPIVEAGEKLGFLPGSFSEKTDPYMLPLYDCIHKMVPHAGSLAEHIQKNTEVAPLAFMRGRTFENSICILDEAQNCTWSQLLLFLTRMGENSKMIVTGDPFQTDLGRDSGLMDVVHRLEGVTGIGMVKFSEECIVRHRLVSEVIKRLQRNT
jgi:phosphate starvation-inducible protein PhoH